MKKQFSSLTVSFQNFRKISAPGNQVKLRYFSQCIYSRTAKNLTHFTKFPANFLLTCLRKYICTAPFLVVQTCILEALGKQIVCIFLYISVRKFLFQRRKNLLFGGKLNIFLKATSCLGLVKCLKIFHFNLNFEFSGI